MFIKPSLCMVVLAMALTTQGQAQAQTSAVTAINVLIEPDLAAAARARQLNARLRESYPQGFALDATHAPHISILHGFVSTRDLDKVYAAVGKVVASEHPQEWRLPAVGYEVTPWQAHVLISIKLQRNPELSGLQSKLVAALTPYLAAQGSPEAFVRTPDSEGIEASTIDYVKTFAQKMTGDHYQPHITAGVSSTALAQMLRSEQPAPLVVTSAAVAFYQLGRFGTARKKLWPR
jgi:hypothetical protein